MPLAKFTEDCAEGLSTNACLCMLGANKKQRPSSFVLLVVDIAHFALNGLDDENATSVTQSSSLKSIKIELVITSNPL